MDFNCIRQQQFSFAVRTTKTTFKQSASSSVGLLLKSQINRIKPYLLQKKSLQLNCQRTLLNTSIKCHTLPRYCSMGTHMRLGRNLVLKGNIYISKICSRKTDHEQNSSQIHAQSKQRFLLLNTRLIPKFIQSIPKTINIGTTNFKQHIGRFSSGKLSVSSVHIPTESWRLLTSPTTASYRKRTA